MKQPVLLECKLKQFNIEQQSNLIQFHIYRHGVRWDKFRAQVQQVMLQPATARKYVAPLNEIATDFMGR